MMGNTVKNNAVIRKCEFYIFIGTEFLPLCCVSVLLMKSVFHKDL